MRRETMLALIGATMLLPTAVEAQRGRGHGGPPAAVAASGRLTGCHPAARARPFDCRATVVYSSNARYAPRRGGHVWVRAGWGPVRFGAIRYYRYDRYLNQSELRELIGLRTVHLIRDEGRRAGLRGALRGEWVHSQAYGRTLLVTMEGIDVAELVDFDQNGIVDEIFIVRPGRDRRVVLGHR
jgi:hypothetical protein